MKEIRDFFIYRDAIFAKKILRFFKEGSSLPVVVADDSGKKYFMKFSATGEGPHALAAEYVAVKIAALIGLPVLEPVFITVNKNTSIGLSKKNQEVEDLAMNSYGINIGFPFIDNARAYDEQHDSKYASSDLRELIFLYDCFLLNVDRTASNPNLLLSGKNIYVTDFGASFLFKEIFLGIKYEESSSILARLKKNIFYSETGREERLTGKADRLDPADVDRIINELPAQWVNNDDKDLLKKRIKEKLHDRDYLDGILKKVRFLEIESDEAIREKQKKNLNEFKKKYGIR